MQGDAGSRGGMQPAVKRGPHANHEARGLRLGCETAVCGLGRDVVEGKGPQRRPQRRLGRRLEGVAIAVGGRLLSVTNAIEAGACRQGDSGWA